MYVPAAIFPVCFKAYIQTADKYTELKWIRCAKTLRVLEMQRYSLKWISKQSLNIISNTVITGLKDYNKEQPQLTLGGSWLSAGPEGGRVWGQGSALVATGSSPAASWPLSGLLGCWTGDSWQPRKGWAGLNPAPRAERKNNGLSEVKINQVKITTAETAASSSPAGMAELPDHKAAWRPASQGALELGRHGWLRCSDNQGGETGSGPTVDPVVRAGVGRLFYSLLTLKGNKEKKGHGLVLMNKK